MIPRRYRGISLCLRRSGLHLTELSCTCLCSTSCVCAAPSLSTGAVAIQLPSRALAPQARLRLALRAVPASRSAC
eukprot:3849939-Pleurochrysis_carterae.AAC.1